MKVNKHFCLCLDEVLSRYDDNVKQGILPFHCGLCTCIHEANDQGTPSCDSKLVVFVKDFTVKVRQFLEFSYKF